MPAVDADRSGDEADGQDEAICPLDGNVIADDDIRALLKPLEGKPGVKLTFLAGACARTYMPCMCMRLSPMHRCM